MPSIIFYTTPISFFIALVITLAKLSSEYELIVVTSFGLNPIKILKIFLPLTLLVSLSLAIISVGLMPKAKHLNQTFLDKKKKEANFNIKASEFGQKFGDWLIYISSKDDKTYSDVKLFQTKNAKDQFVIAKNAILENDKGDLSFKLFNVKSFHIDQEVFNQINYEQMSINDSVGNNKVNSFTTSYDYWKSRIKKEQNIDKFTSYILTSMFPLFSLLLVAAFGYFNPRYEKNRAVAFSVTSIVIYYVLIKILTDNLMLEVLYIVPIAWILSTYLIYSKRVKTLY